MLGYDGIQLFAFMLNIICPSNPTYNYNYKEVRFNQIHSCGVGIRNNHLRV